MNLLRSFVACALLGGWVGPLAAFEGTISMNLSTGKVTRPVIYSIKGDQMRFDSQMEKGASMAGMLDAESGKMIVLMPEQKMYMSFGAPKSGVSPDTTFQETGRTEVIAGYSCKEYILRDKKDTFEVWGTTDLGTMPNLAEAFANRGRRSSWEAFASEKGIFALRVITKDARGRERSRLECVKVEKKSLDDGLFQVPADYTQFKMPGLGDLLRP